MINIMIERKRKKWTQKELAEKMGVTRGTIANWETGKANPSVRKLMLLSDLFDVKVSYLIKG